MVWNKNTRGNKNEEKQKYNTFFKNFEIGPMISDPLANLFEIKYIFGVIRVPPSVCVGVSIYLPGNW